MAQTGKKADVEFIIAGDDNVSQIFKGIIGELHGVQSQTRKTGREVNTSMDQMGDSARRAGDGVQTVGTQLRNIGQGIGGLKRLNDELRETDDGARAAGREMERGFREGGRAADQAANRVTLLKQRVAEVTREMRGMHDALSNATAGFQSFVGDQIRRGAYVGGLAVTGFAAHSMKKEVDKEYEFAKLGSVLKSSYYENGGFNDKAYKKDFTSLQGYIQEQGLRKDREVDTMGLIGIATELAKNNMDPNQVKAALSTVSDFAQATGLDPEVGAKYLANKAEAAKMDYTPENFEKLADQFLKTVDMSSLDPQDLLYSERYTDFANAMGGIDYAVTQAMQVALSKISVDGEKSGTALRTLFLESTQMSVPDSALDRASSTGLAKRVEALITEFNTINNAVEKDGSVAKDNKGTEKIMRKTALLNRYMNGMTSDEQMEVSSMLFGKEAASVGTIFAGDDYKDFLGYIDTIKDSKGITKRYADDRADTRKGQLVALGKSVDELQAKIGRSLNPLLDATTSQMLKLATEGTFSFDEINRGVEESADNLSRELNPEIAETFQLLSKLGTNTFQVGVALSPLAEGTFKSLVKLLNGDIAGATNEIVLAIDATDLKIENLPGELQGLATAAKNAAIFLAAMVAIDKGVQLGENGKKIWDAGKKLGETISGRKTGDVLGELDSKTIKANVVNVYGDAVNSSKNGTPGSSPVAGSGKGVPGAPGTPGASGGSMSALTELALTVGGIFTALGLSAGVGSVVADATEEVTGIKQEKRYNDAAGASDWFTQAYFGAYYGNSADDSARYRNEMKTVGNMIAGFRNRVDYETLNKISQELWTEADKNMKNGSRHIFGDDQEDVASYVEKHINKVRNTPDVVDAQKEKELRRKLEPGWAQQDKLRGYYDGMPAAGMWPTTEPSSKDRAQMIRELESDPFVKGTYKREMLDQLTQRQSSQPASTTTIIPAIMAELNKLQQKPIEVHSDNNLRVVVEDNRAVQVNLESVSSYANRTYNERTLTPMQAVKMKQLE